MKKEDRGSLAYKFLVTDKLKIILTPFNLIEIEDMPDEIVKKNIYDFLDLSCLQKDRDGKLFNFKTFKNALFENSDFKNTSFVNIIKILYIILMCFIKNQVKVKMHVQSHNFD